MGIFSFFKKKNRNRLNPESNWIVLINENEIRTIDYDKTERFMNLKEIKQINIETNDTGPWMTDLWWRIIGIDGQLISVPGGATGENEMLEQFQQFLEFDNSEFIKAMSCTENKLFVCWLNKNVA